MKYLLAILSFMIIGFSSRPVNGQQLVLHGEPVAKSILWVSADLPGFKIDHPITWSISASPKGPWEVLPGITTREIVLLTSYTGKYIKCEIIPDWTGEKVKSLNIITTSQVVYKGNPNTEWFRDAGVGVMLHFLKGVFAREGGSKEYNDAVNNFNVELFAENCKEAGANYVIFALGQNDGYYCSPNHTYDSIVGIAPGTLCSNRDLPADLFKALDKRGLKLMFYLPGNPPINNELVSQKIKYTYKTDSPTSQFTQNCWEGVIREWSLRYGKSLSGWWFDGMYRGGIIETRSDMSLPHNISTHTLAAKAGNYNSIVTYNYGVNTIQSNSLYDDYSAGEESQIVQVPQSRWVVDGVQWFLFTFLGEWWGRAGMRFKTKELIKWSEKVFEKDGVICFDIHTDKSGAIEPDHIRQVQAVKKAFDQKVKN
ncbi:MAG: alpha-L-fucosidase [Prolixibacteraceae bacterium]|jgi:hypothetical protein|nr:alpha-L-fucosidase [Prolixibacteraceae bacterium]